MESFLKKEHFAHYKVFILLFIATQLLLGCDLALKGYSDIVIKCKSHVTQTNSGVVIEFEPIEFIKGAKGEISLTAEGLLNYRLSFDKIVVAPNMYFVYLDRKEHVRSTTIKDNPLPLDEEFDVFLQGIQDRNN